MTSASVGVKTGLKTSLEVYVTEIGAYEAKTHLPRLLAEVERGGSYVITRHGRPVARLIPAQADDHAQVAAAIDRMKARRATLPKVPRAELLAARHDGHKY